MKSEDIESLVIKALQTYKFIGFVHDTIIERDTFLALLTCSLLDHLASTTDAGTLNFLHETITFERSENQQPSIRHFATPIKQFVLDLSRNMTEKFNQEKASEAVFELWDLSRHSLFKQLDRESSIILYDRTLQRLQAMNSKDQLQSDFTYQIQPFNFASLVSRLIPLKPEASIYDPYAMSGESSVDFALQNITAHITTESISQSSKYIRHKLLIAGTSSINAMNSFALSVRPNVQKQQFDLAFTLLQPNMSAEIDGTLHKKTKILAGEFDHERIPKEIIVSRFWEHALIHHILYSLKPDGHAIVFTGLGPLVRQSDFKSRKILLEANHIDAIIQLPAKLIDSRTVPLFAIILKKNRRSSDTIKFIDVSSYCYFNNGINQLTGIDDIARLYQNPDNKSPNIASITSDDVIQNGCSLNVASYVESLDENFEYIDFEETISALSRQQKITNLLIDQLSKAFS
jgi:hypothetical protein